MKRKDSEYGGADFVTSIAPGLIAGGSQCTLAFLQAVTEIHGGDIRYLGPNWLASPDDLTVHVDSFVEIPERNMLRKAIGLLSGRAADRVSPFARKWLSREGRKERIVYFNGDASAGAIPHVSRKLGLRSVFIAHNYPPEYLQSEPSGGKWVERRRRDLLARAALAGFRSADAAVLLTDQDRRHFLRSAKGERPGYLMSPGYFAYRGAEGEQNLPDYAGRRDSILINTNLAVGANAEGALEFVEKAWPIIRKKSRVRLILAGRWPREELQCLAAEDERIDLFVHPEPEEMEEIFQRARVCIAVAFRGSGIKLRVAEALRRGIPVVATAHCSRGYELVGPEVLAIAEQPPELAEATLAFLDRDDLAVARQCCSEHDRLFAFPRGVEKIKTLLNSMKHAGS